MPETFTDGGIWNYLSNTYYKSYTFKLISKLKFKKL